MESARPGFVATAIPQTFASAESDIEVRLLQLAEAVAAPAPELFGDVVNWYRVALQHRGVANGYLESSLLAMQETLRRELPDGSESVLAASFQEAQRAASGPPVVPPSPIEHPSPYARTAQRFLLAVLEGNGDDALEVVERALADGATLVDVHDSVLLPVLQEIGRMWLLGEAPIADEHFASQMAAQVLVMLQRRIPKPPADAKHAVTFAVQGNLHDLGIRIVSQRLQLAGFRVTALGADMPASDLPWAVADRQVDLLAVSATMLLHLGHARAVVEVRNRQMPSRPPVLLGGAPFARLPDLHVRLGADAGAADPAAAVREALRLMTS